MLRTILFLIATLLLLPAIAFYYDPPLAAEHWAALKTLIGLMIGVALLCFISSELTGNMSQVDKLWSLMPIIYAAYVAYASAWEPRMVIMAILVTIWGLRLTYNFARRGGYQWPPWAGEEDYRWSVLRKLPLLNNRLKWAVFNLFFISLYQQALILLFTLPILAAWQGERPLNILDAIAGILLLGAIIIETIADQQQYDYQTEKYRRINAKESLGEAYEVGFCRSGLWGKVRHPNYAAEQMVWISFYLFSVAATGRWLNWSLIGVILLLLLFIGSSDFSEKISAEKYSDYSKYQKEVPRFWPWG